MEPRREPQVQGPRTPLISGWNKPRGHVFPGARLNSIYRGPKVVVKDIRVSKNKWMCILHNLQNSRVVFCNSGTRTQIDGLGKRNFVGLNGFLWDFRVSAATVSFPGGAYHSHQHLQIIDSLSPFQTTKMWQKGLETFWFNAFNCRFFLRNIHHHIDSPKAEISQIAYPVYFAGLLLFTSQTYKGLVFYWWEKNWVAHWPSSESNWLINHLLTWLGIFFKSCPFQKKMERRKIYSSIPPKKSI